jgi:hypothetical protein
MADKLKLVLLNSIIPKITMENRTEQLNTHIHNWFSHGYRYSVPRESTCSSDSDCNPDELCRGGYCAGLHRKYDIHGIFYGDEYNDMVGEKNNPLSYLGHGEYYRPNDFFYDYISGGHPGTVKANNPILSTELDLNADIGYNYNYNYN